MFQQVLDRKTHQNHKRIRESVFTFWLCCIVPFWRFLLQLCLLWHSLNKKNKLTNFFVKSKGLPKLVGTSVECEARCNIVKRIGENGRRSILSIYQALQVHIDNCSSQIIRKVIFSSWLPKMSWMHLLGNHYYLHNAFCSSLWRYSSHHLCTKCHLSHKISLMAKSKHFQLT